MIIILKKLKKSNNFIKYKVADTDIIFDSFKNYLKENNLSTLNTQDKINILKQLNYSDEEINIILKHIGDINDNSSTNSS